MTRLHLQGPFCKTLSRPGLQASCPLVAHPQSASREVAELSIVGLGCQAEGLVWVSVDANVLRTRKGVISPTCRWSDEASRPRKMVARYIRQNAGCAASPRSPFQDASFCFYPVCAVRCCTTRVMIWSLIGSSTREQQTCRTQWFRGGRIDSNRPYR